MSVLIINAHPDPALVSSCTNRMVAHLLSKCPKGEAQVLNLALDAVPGLDATAFSLFAKMAAGADKESGAAAALTVEESARVARMGEILAQFKAATHLVIALPMHNFSVPARLKDYLDVIVMPGETFRYDEQGTPQGLMAGHKLWVLMSSGSVYTRGVLSGMDFITPYLQGLFAGFLGFDRVDITRAEGTMEPGIGPDVAVDKALAEIDQQWAAFMAG